MVLSNDVMLAGAPGARSFNISESNHAGLRRHGLWQIHSGRAATNRDGCSLPHFPCALRCRSFSTSRNPSLADCLIALSYHISSLPALRDDGRRHLRVLQGTTSGALPCHGALTDSSRL